MIDPTNKETVIAAVFAAAIWIWPYVVDAVSSPEAPPQIKRLATKAAALVTGTTVAGFSFDMVDGGTKDAVVSVASGVVAALASRWGIEISHHATQGSAGRSLAKALTARGPSVDDLAPGDRIPLRTKVAMRKTKPEVDADEFAQFQAFIQERDEQPTSLTPEAVQQMIDGAP